MFRIDMDSFSMTSGFSGTSKTSREKQKTSRFSLRRFSINPFFRRQSSSARSVRSIRSNSEIETRSISSSQNSNNSEKEPSEDAASASLTGRSTPQHTIECPLCLSHHADAAFPPISTCHHRSCRDCLRQYLRIEIMESRVNIACPECAEKFHPNDIQRIVEDISLVRKYEEFMLRRILVSEPDARWCPAPDCGYAVIASGCASCPKLKCERPGCETFFCYHCKQYWHPNQTCDAARAERSSNLRSASISYSHESGSQKGDIKPCPRCGAFIIKMDDGSCNHMTCAVCGAEFCWLCMKEISDLHYLSPSGCTFWGKKPWSRKKKILWQLGTLVGAPVGIGLVAGIAVPAMVIGIPVWVGRKLHTKYEHASKHKRNLVITGGVSASILISPVLAGLAVGIGVPILLAYVYGVVPISLCRSGGCGVTTTNSGGVRFEFEEDNETTVGVSGPYTGGDGQSMETASHNPNPSIGPSIGEMSVAMTNSLSASGSHMERAGLMRDESDRDSASNRALIGNSLSGSLSGSAVAGPSGFQNRLEVHADVSANQAKRNSLSSESANLSLDAKSATVSWGDNASTKGLAGSICTRDKDNMSAVVPPLEVQVDVVSSSARYRHGSESSNQPNNMPGSPGSSRSAGGVVSEEGKTRRYWRQSRSVGERLHEHAERREQSERLSVHSFTPDAEEDVAEMGACGGVPDLRGPTPTALKGTTSRGSRHSVSFECVTSRAGSRSPGELPEVESDRPAMCTMVMRQHSDERPQTVAMKHSDKDPKKTGRKPFRKLSWKKTIHKNPLSP